MCYGEPWAFNLTCDLNNSGYTKKTCTLSHTKKILTLA